MAFVRPGPDAFVWLANVVRDLKRDDPFRPVTVLVPNDYAGRMMHWHLGRSGGYVNVIAARVSQVIAAIAQSAASRRLPPLLPILEESAVREALRRHASAFGSVGHRSLQQALLDLFRELRRCEVDVDALDDAQQTEAARAALAAYRDFQTITAAYDDRTRRANRASDLLDRARSIPTVLARFGPLVLFLPTRVDPAEVRFLAAAARWTPFYAAIADVSDPQGVGDEPGQDIAKRLAEALGIEPPVRDPAPRDLDLRAEVRILRTPDAAEEVREVVRCIVDDLEHGTPLHRMAILYRQDDPYAPLVREALDAAGLPWSSSEGKRLDQTRPGRCLLGLLQLPERRFAREAVMEWLETEPILDPPIGDIPVASWDRLTRAANVVRGVEQWRERLVAYASAIDEKARDREREGATDAALLALRRQATAARSIAEFVATLAADLQPPSGRGTWASFVDWARALRDRYVGRPSRPRNVPFPFGKGQEGPSPSWREDPAHGLGAPGVPQNHQKPSDTYLDEWTADELAAADMVDRALEELRAADRIGREAEPTLAEFLAALTSALDTHRLPTGRLGQGILIEPVGAVAGLAFDRVYLLGMREGAFPPTPSVDPFFPDSATDPLDRRARQLARERQDFLVALASADHGTLTLCVPDTDGARAAFPSRWLLEVASVCAGRQLSASELGALNRSQHPWLRVVDSALQSVSRDVTPADLEDRRLQQAARWTSDGRPLLLHPMARRSDLPLGRGLELTRERRSSRFTQFDGNVSALASQARRLGSIFTGRRTISASAVQSWATCGFQYFLARVLDVEPTERPEDAWTIDALERGALIHEILEAFFRELRQRGEPRPDQRYGPGDVALLERIAAERFTRIEASGITGHPIAWENERRRILADLRVFLAEDEQWRIEQALTPWHFEQPFGFGLDGSWPALDVQLPVAAAEITALHAEFAANGANHRQSDGIHSVEAAEAPLRAVARLRFRGLIDRIDLDAARGRAHVFDYKTGSAGTYDGLAKDPVVGGQHVQLALYGRAVRRNLPGVTTVSATFWFITARGEFKQIGPTADEEAIAARLDEVLSVIARGIGAGAFPQVPGDFKNGDFVNCRNCDFERVCPAHSHRDALWKRKQADPLAALHQMLAPTTRDGAGAMSDE